MNQEKQVAMKMAARVVLLGAFLAMPALAPAAEVPTETIRVAGLGAPAEIRAKMPTPKLFGSRGSG